MPNFGNLINYRRQEMPKYGTVRLLWPCQPWKWLTEVTEHSQRTVLKKIKCLGEPEIPEWPERLLVEFDACLVKLWRKMILIGINKLKQ